MESYDGNHLAGIFEQDGSVKCIDCMTAEDWRNLMDDSVITVEYLERSGDWIYCDYCQSKL
jgi:hypothetical protein